MDKRETCRASRAVACQRKLAVDLVADRSSWNRAEVEHRGQRVLLAVHQMPMVACSCRMVLVAPLFA